MMSMTCFYDIFNDTNFLLEKIKINNLKSTYLATPLLCNNYNIGQVARIQAGIQRFIWGEEIHETKEKLGVSRNLTRINIGHSVKSSVENKQKSSFDS